MAIEALNVSDGAAPMKGGPGEVNLRKVILAASLGTLFEWYDFYLYGSLAVFFGGLFFPKGNDTAQLLASLATFGAGFGVRPLGALVFGHIGDLIGRKYTFLITMATMRGFSSTASATRSRTWGPPRAPSFATSASTMPA